MVWYSNPPTFLLRCSFRYTPHNLAPLVRISSWKTCVLVPPSSFHPTSSARAPLCSSPWSQIFTHILRDWTSEGDSVRAAVYDPLLRALDKHFGGQEEVAPATNGSEGGCDGSSGSRRRGDPRGGTAMIDIDGNHDDTGESRYSDRRGQGREGDRPEPSKGSHCCYAPCTDRPRTGSVLVPGAGLGRLAVEVAARGYASVHANELSETS